MRCFLSYQQSRIEATRVRHIGAHLTLIGLDVWFDEWELQAGDSIPGKLNTGLEASRCVSFSLWSGNASRSNWVRQELNSAIMRSMSDNSPPGSSPRMLEMKTPLPALISDRKGIDFSDPKEGMLQLAGDLTGTRSRK